MAKKLVILLAVLTCLLKKLVKRGLGILLALLSVGSVSLTSTANADSKPLSLENGISDRIINDVTTPNGSEQPPDGGE